MFIYRSMRPYYKFTLPGLPVDDRETAAWEAASGAEPDVRALKTALSAARDNGAQISARSQARRRL